jgi:hypothetical protein
LGLVPDAVAAGLIGRAAGTAAVPRLGVAVIARLVNILDPIAAGLIGRAVGTAAVPRLGVAVIARLINILDPVAAGLIGHAVGTAAVPRLGVAVIARLANILDPVAAGLIGRAVGTAAVSRLGVVVVTYLVRDNIDLPVSTALQGVTCPAASITVEDVAVITFFAGLGDPIAAVGTDAGVLAGCALRS